MIHVIATITLNTGTRAAFLVEFTKVTPLVREEVGCIEYQATIDVATPQATHPPREDVVVVVEKWADLAALQAHSTAKHMADYRVHVKDFIKSVSLQILEPA
jgi:quinol monooxygenase YgiN